MSLINRITMAALFSLLAALLLGGCGSGNKEGSSPNSGSALFGGVATVGDTACNQCHSAVTEALTGETIVSQYQLSSPHNVTGLGCESCHGGGAGHNGVGPIPYTLAGFTPNEKGARCATCHDGVQSLTVNGVATTPRATNSNTFESSNHATGTPSHTTTVTCTRCHTHEGAVLGNIIGWTGTKDVLDDATIQAQLPIINTYTGFKCETCHQHGGGLRVVKGTTAAGGTLTNWDPNNNRKTDQFDLCTSCHTMYNYNGSLLLVDGNTHGGVATGIVGHHETSWYRIIASTHFDNPNTGVGLATNLVEGYNLRKTGENPCFDCHGHEAKTETRNASRTPPTDSTIHTDWAKSAHAGQLLAQKITAIGATSGATAVAAAMGAGADETSGAAWVHYNWDQTTGTGNRAACQMCHTSTGISNYLVNQDTALTGYDPANNDFSHLSGWTAATGSPQNELLYCWGCHSNAGTGALRNTSQAIFSFTINSLPVVVTNAGKSTACIVCHGGRGSAGEAAANDARSSRFNGHHAPTAGFLYSAQTHIGYEYAGLSYANPSFFAHDQIGVGTNGSGPCASCHMGPSATDGRPSHTFSPVTESGGVITAINNQALCNTCHTPGGAFEMTPAKLEEESAGYQQAGTILNNWVGNVAGYQNYLNLAITSSNYNDTVAVPNNAYGAFQNAKITSDEPCAYVHNRFYAKRLIFDAIDWMDNGVLDGTISIDATTYPEAAAWYGAPAGTTGTFAATRP